MDHERYAPVVIRYALGLIFVIFAIDQFVRPEYWLGYLPAWAVSRGIADGALIMLNATFDLVLGLLLVAGLFTRLAALIAGLHLFAIAASLGYNDVAIRDAILGIIAIGVAMRGPDEMCLDARWNKDV